MSLQNPLWDFALKTYSEPDVEAACLALQDSCGLSVNAILFALWLAEQGREYHVDAAAHEQIAQWQNKVTASIRRARLHVRGQRDTSGLYQTLKTVELEAEQAELAMFYQLTEQMPVIADCDVALLRYNNLLAVSGSECGGVCREQLENLRQALLKAQQKLEPF